MYVYVYTSEFDIIITMMTEIILLHKNVKIEIKIKFKVWLFLSEEYEILVHEGLEDIKWIEMKKKKENDWLVFFFSRTEIKFNKMAIVFLENLFQS